MQNDQHEQQSPSTPVLHFSQTTRGQRNSTPK